MPLLSIKKQLINFIQRTQVPDSSNTKPDLPKRILKGIIAQLNSLLSSNPATPQLKKWIVSEAEYALSNCDYSVKDTHLINYLAKLALKKNQEVGILTKPQVEALSQFVKKDMLNEFEQKMMESSAASTNPASLPKNKNLSPLK